MIFTSRPVSVFHCFPNKLKRLLFNSRKKKFEAVTTSGKQTEFLAHMALYSWNKNIIAAFNHYFHPKPFIFLELLKMCLEVNNKSLLPEIKVPTLIIGGKYDSVLPVWIQASMHKLVPDLKFIIMRNTGHLAKIEAKDRLTNYCVGSSTSKRLMCNLN